MDQIRCKDSLKTKRQTKKHPTEATSTGDPEHHNRRQVVKDHEGD